MSASLRLAWPPSPPPIMLWRPVLAPSTRSGLRADLQAAGKASGTVLGMAIGRVGTARQGRLDGVCSAARVQLRADSDRRGPC